MCEVACWLGTVGHKSLDTSLDIWARCYHITRCFDSETLLGDSKGHWLHIIAVLARMPKESSIISSEPVVKDPRQQETDR